VTETPNPNIMETDEMAEDHPVRKAVLSIGSNLGDSMAYLQGALDSLADTPDLSLVAVSPVYETEPVDSPVEAENYLNVVVLVDTPLSEQKLMDRCRAIEDAFDRERHDQRNMPRTLDVDLIVLGDRRSDDEALTLPHPRAHERAFVLAPWRDVDPDAELLDHGRVADLLEKLGTAGVDRRDDLVLDLQ
jgi:2-amino-4-hydroxy-6-hydroxymethyldihydropteridine diphosphokinase